MRRDGRIQFALLKVMEPETKMPKLVQINWAGEGVPESRKGLFHSQAGQVAELFKGTHLTIQARSEADLDEDFIMKRVKAAGGSKYSGWLVYTSCSQLSLTFVMV